MNRLLLPPTLVWRLLDPSLEFSVQELEALLDSLYPPLPSRTDYFQAASRYESSVYMTSQLLRDVDNFSMAALLEVRAPFLNHQLYSYVWRLPARLKRTRSKTKSLLVDSVPGGLPHFVPVNAKRGFTFPLQDWARGEMGARLRDTVTRGNRAHHLNPGAVVRLLDGFDEGRVHWSVLWSLFAFTNWRQHHEC